MKKHLVALVILVCSYAPVAHAEFCVSAGVVAVCYGQDYDNYRLPRFDVGFVLAQYQAALAYIDYIKSTITVTPENVNNTETGFMELDDLMQAGANVAEPAATLGLGYFYGPINEVRTSNTFRIEWNPGYYVQQIPYLLDSNGNQIAANSDGTYTLPNGTHSLTARQGFFNYATFQFDWYETPVNITINPAALLYWVIDTQQIEPIVAPDQNGDCPPNDILISNVNGAHTVCASATVYTSEPDVGFNFILVGSSAVAADKRGIMANRIRFQAQKGATIEGVARISRNSPISTAKCLNAINTMENMLTASNKVANYTSCLATIQQVVINSGASGLHAGFQKSYPNQGSPVYHCDIEVFAGVACVY